MYVCTCISWHGYVAAVQSRVLGLQEREYSHVLRSALEHRRVEVEIEIDLALLQLNLT